MVYVNVVSWWNIWPMCLSLNVDFLYIYFQKRNPKANCVGPPWPVWLV